MVPTAASKATRRRSRHAVAAIRQGRIRTRNSVAVRLRSIWAFLGATILVVSFAAYRSAGGDPVGGTDPQSVSDLLAARAAGTASQKVALAGFWSNESVPHTCQIPDGPPGDLEILCHDGEYGIVEADEPILVVTANGQATPALSAHLTPWLPETIRDKYVLLVPHAAGPIAVTGHFDDPRAVDCRPAAKQMCMDRLVVDTVVSFFPKALTQPSNDLPRSPHDGMPLFDQSSCAGAVGYSFVGWTTTQKLGIAFDRQGSVFAMVTEAAVLLGGPEWNDDPKGSELKFRVWGRMVCVAQPDFDGIVEYSVLPETSFVEWNDGVVTRGQALER